MTREDTISLIRVHHDNPKKVGELIDQYTQQLRERDKEDPTFEFDTSALSKKDQLHFMMLLSSGVKVSIVNYNQNTEK